MMEPSELLVILIILGCYAFSIFTISHCIRNDRLDKNQKVFYCILIVFTAFIGAGYYLYKHYRD